MDDTGIHTSKLAKEIGGIFRLGFDVFCGLTNHSTSGYAKGCGASCANDTNSADVPVGRIINAGPITSSRYAG